MSSAFGTDQESKLSAHTRSSPSSARALARPCARSSASSASGSGKVA
jgi:hypothetical protein